MSSGKSSEWQFQTTLSEASPSAFPDRDGGALRIRGARHDWERVAKHMEPLTKLKTK